MQSEDFQTIKINAKKKIDPVSIQLVSSKSESNRALIINALAGGNAKLGNLSDARDTQTMMRLLKTDGKTWDVLDAGTTMRFLTAYAAAKNLNKVLTGTPRMQERPIKLLVDALLEIGADIKYLKNEGYPPHEILGLKEQKKQRIRIRGDVSSQYISALAMIAPVLPQGLEIELTGKIGSRPYIEMTLSLMRKFGAEVSFEGNMIDVKPRKYKGAAYVVESDWSGASYWFSFVAIAETAEVKLLGLRKDSLQGDIAIVEIMGKLGVQADFDSEGVKLTKKAITGIDHIDFSHCPDLAQTVCVTLAAKGVSCTMTGLESLRIKETDRIAALQNELAKFGAKLVETDAASWKLIPPAQLNFPEDLRIHTYDDHRMAMAFAPLAAATDIIIEEPSVVKKSYPGYWDDLKKAGFEMVLQ